MLITIEGEYKTTSYTVDVTQLETLVEEGLSIQQITRRLDVPVMVAKLAIQEAGLGIAHSVVQFSLNDPRYGKLRTAVQQGLSYAAIGDQIGLSPEGVRQLIIRCGLLELHHTTRREVHGLVPLAPIAAQGLPVAQMAALIGVKTTNTLKMLQRRGLFDQWSAAYAANGRRADIEQFLASDGSTVPTEIGDEFDYLVTRTRSASQATGRTYTDQEMLYCIKEAADALGGTISYNRYEKYRIGKHLEDGRVWPSGQQGHLRFGSWMAACELAGVSCGVTYRGGQYVRKWTMAEIQGYVTEYIAHSLNECHLPTFNGYSEWCVQDSQRPSLSTVRAMSVDVSGMIAVAQRARRLELLTMLRSNQHT